MHKKDEESLRFFVLLRHPNIYKYIIPKVNCQYKIERFKQNLPNKQKIIVNFAHLVN